MKVIIEEYNPLWVKSFEDEKEHFLTIFKGVNFEVEHIGSTAVNELGAKPVIDIMIGLQDFSTANKYINSIEHLDYQYISQYESTMPYRRFFIKEKEGKRTHHIHMVELNSDFWKRHLAFRDRLRNDVQIREAYYLLKKKLSLDEWNSGDEYAQAKSEFIAAVIKSN